MERLTKRISLGNGKTTVDFSNEKCHEFLTNHQAGVKALFEKLAYYEDLEEKLKSVYGDCDGLLEKVVDGLVKHEGVEFEKPMKARLLTDEDVDKWDRLKVEPEQILADLEEERIRVKTTMYKYQREGCEFMATMGRGKYNGIAYAINLIISKMGIKNYEGVKYE
ncbi:MAG: hypothetical protein IKW37_01405 [Bacteroidaceae bacterium]|nr:hypothetical protein [Bacteroidaceae bacterium]